VGLSLERVLYEPADRRSHPVHYAGAFRFLGFMVVTL
jgi:hypothetical protein